MSAQTIKTYSIYCPECGTTFNSSEIQSYCHSCNSPLLVKYDISKIKKTLSPKIIASRPRGLWRWQELIPVIDPVNQLSLGEGDTPLLQMSHLAAKADLPQLYIKDESLNATASFKARGLAVAVSKAKELGVKQLVIPTAGNAGGALAAYAARAGLPSTVFMPEDTPLANQHEVSMAGADLRLIAGLINDCGKAAAAFSQQTGAFDVSTFKEPYRVEGKKTLGLEIAESFHWQLPDVLIYPTGGGTGLVGMWKAFSELEELGWITSKRPRMVVVQAAGCAPIVRAFTTQAARALPWENAATLASGLRVPVAFADRLILKVLRESSGTALTVTDEQIKEAQSEVARSEGILCAPEGAATWAAAQTLKQSGWIRSDETVVMFNTGSGLKYL